MILAITPTDAPPADEIWELQQRIERSSNFRFAWQFFRLEQGRVASPGHARRVLETVITSPHCHRFLRSTFDPMYDADFTISPLHEHATIADAEGEFPNTLAAAAEDRLGAYSHHLRDATPKEAARVRRIFSAAGSYRAFQLLPGSNTACQLCRQHHNNHLFSSWFYGVAWDWCFVLGWPEAGLAWVGCLTDTD
jgi:hypothetical protein